MVEPCTNQRPVFLHFDFMFDFLFFKRPVYRMENRTWKPKWKKQGADWGLKHVPLRLFCFEKINDFQRMASFVVFLALKDEKANRKPKQQHSASPTGQCSHDRISHQNCRTQHTTHCQHGDTAAQIPRKYPAARRCRAFVSRQSSRSEDK